MAGIFESQPLRFGTFDFDWLRIDEHENTTTTNDLNYDSGDISGFQFYRVVAFVETYSDLARFRLSVNNNNASEYEYTLIDLFNSNLTTLDNTLGWQMLQPDLNRSGHFDAMIMIPSSRASGAGTGANKLTIKSTFTISTVSSPATGLLSGNFSDSTVDSLQLRSEDLSGDPSNATGKLFVYGKYFPYIG